jgi:hypothetical protein
VRDPAWRQRLAVLLLVVAVLAGLAALRSFWRRQLSHLTGAAQWVWVTDTLERLHPLAGLFVGRVELDAPPASALLAVSGDREYVVYVNGTAAACGWSRPGFRLELYDVAHLLRQGENVVAIEVRSPTPVGGLLFSLDVDHVPHPVLLSDRHLVARHEFSLAAPAASDPAVPVVWGMPPRAPWDYPAPLPRPRTLDQAVVEEPVRLPAQRAEPVAGGGWRFTVDPPVFGYLWLEFDDDGAAHVVTAPEPDAISADEARWEASPAVRLPGQRRWLDVQPTRIGVVYVFGGKVPRALEVWPVPEEFRPTAPGVVPGTHAPVPRTRWTTRTRPG